MALQTFTAGQVLTAAQLTSLQANDYNQTVSAKTSSYTLVAADKGTRITMSSASATTITVNTSLFTAGDSLRIQNLNGGGVCTITAGTATVTSAGPLAIPSWGGGQLYFTSASAAVWFPDAVTATPGALTLISSTSLNTGTTTVSVNNCFSATYDNYLIMIGGMIKSATTAANQFRLRVGGVDNSSANYNWGGPVTDMNTSVIAGDSGLGSAQFRLAPRLASTSTSTSSGVIWLSSPALATFTGWVNQGSAATDVNTYSYTGYHGVATAYDGFSLLSAGGNFTGGTVKVYGLANS